MPSRRSPTGFLSISALLFSSLLPLSAPASITIISTRTEVRPQDSDCRPSGTCDLKDVRFIEMKKLVKFPNEPARFASHLTDTRFAYTVDPKDGIESYGIVQFIRGCMFESWFVNGRVEKHLSIDRDHFGRKKTFQHRSWEIDSDSTDPLYSSYEGVGRFALLRWNKDPHSLNADTATWYANARPPHGSVFVSDLPGSAALLPGSAGPDVNARNASLEFKSCLFRTSDLPTATTPEGAGVNLSKALWCVEWSHNYVYDFKARKMTSPPAIDPVCEAR